MTSILQRRRGRGQGSRPGGSFILLFFLAAGCGSKGAVSLTARIDTAEASFATSVLGTTVAGRFDLVLELGDVAPRGTSVELGSFALKRGDASIVDPLELSASASFPLELSPGDSTTVPFTFEQSGEGLGAELCGEELTISGTVIDTLSDGRPTPASSPPFAAVCP